MKLRILGCSGGIGGAEMRSTSLLLDGRILLDAGTGVGDLTLNEMAAVEHVFLTHAHMDHIASLPLMLDSVWGMNPIPLTVHAPNGVLEALKTHIFNWVIWPDFSVLPSPANPCLIFKPFNVGDSFDIGGGVIHALPVDHNVPAVAYEISTLQGSTVFSGDTGSSPAFLKALKALPALRRLIVECAFPNQEKALAIRSGHFCPELLVEWLGDFSVEQLCITHLKPQMADQTMEEVESALAGRTDLTILRLRQGSELQV